MEKREITIKFSLVNQFLGVFSAQKAHPNSKKQIITPLFRALGWSEKLVRLQCTTFSPAGFFKVFYFFPILP